MRLEHPARLESVATSVQAGQKMPVKSRVKSNAKSRVNRRKARRKSHTNQKKVPRENCSPDQKEQRKVDKEKKGSGEIPESSKQDTETVERKIRRMFRGKTLERTR